MAAHRRPRLLPDRRLAPLLVALMAGLLLSELDQSMVAAALPTMVDELDGVGDLMWVNTAYLLAATGVLPLYGALGDRWGRRPVILTALGLIMVGSVVGALASGMSVLILARVIQGLGAGGMLVLVQAAVADVLPVRDRAPVMSLIGAVFGAAAIGGPAARRLAGRGSRLALDVLDQPAGRWARPGRGLVVAAAPAGRCRDPALAGGRPAAGRAVPDADVRPGRRGRVWCSAPRCSVWSATCRPISSSASASAR